MEVVVAVSLRLDRGKMLQVGKPPPPSTSKNIAITGIVVNIISECSFNIASQIEINLEMTDKTDCYTSCHAYVHSMMW